MTGEGRNSSHLIMFDNCKDGYHYALIKNFDRLLGSCNKHQRKFRPYCCHCFVVESYTPEIMKEHMDTCFKYGGAKTVMPEKGKKDILQFKDYS